MIKIIKIVSNQLIRKIKQPVLYVLLMIIPLIITDVLVIGVIYNSEMASRKHEMEKVCNAVNYTFSSQANFAAQLAKGIYTSRYVNDFINTQFETDLDYYSKYYDFFNDTMIDLVDGANGMEYKFYLDNDTIVNGSEFQRLEKVYDFNWYNYMIENEYNSGIYFDFERSERRIYFFQRMNFFDKKSKNVLLIELDYGTVQRILQNMNYHYEAYICDNDRILISNERFSSVGKMYTEIDKIPHSAYKNDISLYKMDLFIMVVDDEAGFVKSIRGWWYLVVLLVLVNILLSLLMLNINTVKTQEMVVARQKAELLALRSQINPHFLFNALESLRMHSVLKNEIETAEMVEKLAKLQRQYTEWQDDSVSIEKELEFVEAYLGLQKYRFGDRLSFDISVDEDCKAIAIPKLSIVTFVENACVHGIESKSTPGWIFVRVSKEEDKLLLEIEDTGNGMDDEERDALLYRMRNASIDMLKEKGRVGIVNACLRLKLASDGSAVFDIDSEQGIGTIMQIKIPLN